MDGKVFSTLLKALYRSIVVSGKLSMFMPKQSLPYRSSERRGHSGNVRDMVGRIESIPGPWTDHEIFRPRRMGFLHCVAGIHEDQPSLQGTPKPSKSVACRFHASPPGHVLILPLLLCRLNTQPPPALFAVSFDMCRTGNLATPMPVQVQKL